MQQKDCSLPAIACAPCRGAADVLRAIVSGPPGTPYAGGAYHGVLKFPCEYPHKAPSVLMYTPSGRFQTNTRICMSMSECVQLRGWCGGGCGCGGPRCGAAAHSLAA